MSNPETSLTTFPNAETPSIPFDDFNTILAHAEKISNGQFDFEPVLRAELKNKLNIENADSLIDFLKTKPATDIHHQTRLFLAQFNFIIEDQDANYRLILHGDYCETQIIPKNKEISPADAAPPTNTTLAQRVIKIQFHLQNMSNSAIIIGQELIECKKEVGHGNWANWLKDNFNLTQQSANRFMRVAERFGKLNTGVQFNSTQMVEMLALPEGEEEKFIEEKAAEGKPVEEMSKRQLNTEIKKYKDALKKTEAELQRLQKYHAETVTKHELFKGEKEHVEAALRQENEFLKTKTRNLENSAQVAVQDAVATLEDNEKLHAEIEYLKNLPPQVVEVTKEVIPADYESAKQTAAELQSRVAELQAQGEEAHKTIEDLQNQVLDAISKQGEPKIEYVETVPEDYQALQKKLSDTELKLAGAQKDAQDARAIVAAEKYIEQLFSAASALNNSIEYLQALRIYMQKHPNTKNNIAALFVICKQLDVACDIISEDNK